MKRLLIVIFPFLILGQLSAQGTDFVRRNALRQLNDLIVHGYEFLGKSEYQILTRGRPESISGGDIWKATVKIPPVTAQHSKYINIETGSGALFTIYISSKTGLAFKISFTPLNWASLSEIDENLKAKYYINEQGLSEAIKAVNGDFVSFRIEMWENVPYVDIYAVDIEKSKFRFIE